MSDPPKPFVSPAWMLGLPLLSLAAMSASLPERRMWVAPFAAAVYALTQCLLPGCRFRRDHYLGPVNIALFLFLLQLFVLPSLIMLVGPEHPTLSSLPSYASIANAILIQVTAYVALCIGLANGPRPGAPVARVPWALAGPGPCAGLTALYFVLGAIGFAAVFGTPARMIGFLLSTEEMRSEPDASFTALAGTLLRPFFAFALVAAWSLWGRRLGMTGACVSALAVALCITVANMTYGFNRAAFVFPVISLLAMFSAKVRRIPFGATATAAIMAVPLLIGVGMFRSSRMEGGQPVVVDLEMWLENVSTDMAAYVGGPQFSALLGERLGWGETLYGGSTLIASALTPVPILGKGFRETNGPALYNEAIYRMRGIEDQIIPCSLELFANFHLPGTALGFVLLGLLLATIQQWFALTESAFAAFCVQYAGLWTAMLAAWSVSIYAQIAVYFFGPIYLYLAVQRLPALGRMVFLPRIRKVAA